MQGVNANFVTELMAALMEHGVTQETPVFFMCQSGGRSKMSAMQCTAQGYTRCYNLAEGFEGALDEHKHRNSVSGWKVAGLPWTQV
jgi:rhodanese-related sulfurtransferase